MILRRSTPVWCAGLLWPFLGRNTPLVDPRARHLAAIAIVSRLWISFLFSHFPPFSSPFCPITNSFLFFYISSILVALFSIANSLSSLVSVLLSLSLSDWHLIVSDRAVVPVARANLHNLNLAQMLPLA
jgi:hypothetical protein